jgi:DNA modification methylase
MENKAENKDSQPIYEIDPNLIQVPKSRQRTSRSFSREALNQLKASITQLGQLQPGTCLQEGENIILLFGYRRLVACKELGISYRYELTKDILDPVRKKEIELHENIIRENLHFLDVAKAHAELHKFYQLHKGGIEGARQPSGKRKEWTLEDTASILGVSTGKLSEDIKINRYANALPEISNAKTLNEAKASVKRIETQAVRQIALEKALAASQPKTEVVSKQDNGSTEPDPQAQVATLIKQYSNHLHLGKFEEALPKLAEPGTFSVVFFDPPWGVGLDKSYANAGDKELYKDDPKSFFKNLRLQLTLLYEYMAPNSHLYLKFAIAHHFFVYQMLKRTGFEVNKIPILWHKIGTHRTRQPDKWPGQCYEPIAFARKGNLALIQTGRPNIIPTRPPGPKMKQDHPDAMHPDLPRELLLRSAMPGTKVLDPCCGSGMFGVACESLRAQLMLDYTMIEEKRTFYELSMQNLVKGYENIVTAAEKDKEDQKESAKDYKSVPIGSANWIRIWTSHPELRNEMTDWQKGGQQNGN